jgi:hypothetical protein
MINKTKNRILIGLLSLITLVTLGFLAQRFIFKDKDLETYPVNPLGALELALEGPGNLNIGQEGTYKVVIKNVPSKFQTSAIAFSISIPSDQFEYIVDSVSAGNFAPSSTQAFSLITPKNVSNGVHLNAFIGPKDSILLPNNSVILTFKVKAKASGFLSFGLNTAVVANSKEINDLKTITDKQVIVSNQPSKLSTPEFNPNGANYSDGIPVKITSNIADSIIKYCLTSQEGENCVPSTTASVTPASVLITETTKIRAFAEKDGFLDSDIATSDFYTKDTTPKIDNLLRNGDFSLGSQSWSFYSAKGGNFVVESSVGKVIIAENSSNIQLYQSELALKPNTDYSLTFKSKASRNRDASIALHEHKAPYTSYAHVGPVDLTTEWKDYTFEFTTNSNLKEFSTNVRFRVWFSNNSQSGDVVWLDDFVLSELSKAPTHNVCSNNQCIAVEGKGKSTCQVDIDCAEVLEKLAKPNASKSGYILKSEKVLVTYPGDEQDVSLELCTNESCTSSIPLGSTGLEPFKNENTHTSTVRLVAKKPGYTNSDVVAVTFSLLGDLDQSGDYSINDVLTLLKYLYGDFVLPNQEIADLRSDTVIDILDVIKLLQIVFN